MAFNLFQNTKMGMEDNHRGFNNKKIILKGFMKEAANLMIFSNFDFLADAYKQHSIIFIT